MSTAMTSASSEYFKKVAGDWDQLREGFFDDALRQAAIARAYLRPDMVVADVGAGTGFLSAALAPLVQRVYALDGSPEMLEVAQRNLAGVENVVFQPADGAALPLPDASLDAVFANMYLHHCPDPQAAIREMARLVRPGGRLVITDLDQHAYAWLKAEMADEWLGFARESIRGWLKAAGLVNVIVASTNQSCCAESTSAVLTGASGEKAEIGVFVAVGSQPVAGVTEAVQSEYAGHAEQKTSCGCSSSGSAACCGSSLAEPEGASASSIGEANALAVGYSAAETAEVPPEAAEIELGCGNPIAMANLRPGEVVLDIGSGGGFDAFLAARRVGASGRVIGVDMTPAMLERARATAQRRGFDQVEFRQGHAESLPVPDTSVDVILSNCVINLTVDKGVVFAEAFRALKPGGRLEVSDVVTGGSFPGDLREDPQNWGGCIYGALPEAEYLELISQAGFQNVSVRRSSTPGEVAGVPVYSLVVSARKPGPGAAASCGCGCGN
ncbi:MAG TPA: arsenite methyltransferase [Anaerolineaceae bacterium]|nr:arsenite methyltransferase [Anaerolineaceae bacterium]